MLNSEDRAIRFQDTGKISVPKSGGGAYMKMGEQRSQAGHAVQNKILKDDGCYSNHSKKSLKMGRLAWQ